MMQAKCIFCGADVALVHVHGHYQCPACKTNALPCCDGGYLQQFSFSRRTGHTSRWDKFSRHGSKKYRYKKQRRVRKQYLLTGI